MKNKHEKLVQNIASQVIDFSRLGKTFRIFHGTTNSTRIQDFKKHQLVDISQLNQVIKISKKEKYVIVEPNVPMDKLVEETLKYGLIPPVVMEFPGITVGGGIQGGAGESSSFKWGLFNNCFSEYEVVLGNGKIVKVSEKENADLFYGLVCSYGSLGIITSAKLNLISAKKFVKLSYLRVTSFEEIIEVIKKQTKKEVDFIDGILFLKSLGVVVIGELVNKADLPIVTFSKAGDEWFYLHAEKTAQKYDKWEELTPIKDYLFRYDRGAFWMGKYAFDKANLVFNRWTRFLLAPMFKTQTLYRFLQALKSPQQFMIQDVSLPKENVLAFLQYIDKELSIYPLWLCPLKPTIKEFMSPTFQRTDLIINIGVWGRLRKEFPDILKLNRALEKKSASLAGRKILYAHCYYPKKEFWSIYDYETYDKLREKYSAKKTLPDIYEKIIVNGKYNASFFKGLFSILISPKKLPVSK